MRSTLFALTLLAGCGTAVAEATLIGVFPWFSDAPDFGGISGIEVLDGGNSFVVINDRAQLQRGTFQRDGGEITGISVTQSTQLRRSNGRIMQPTDIGIDSEGLAIGLDGTLYVSFEGPARVLAYTDVTGEATRLTPHPDFGNLQHNSALEGLAVDVNGTLYTLPERSGRAMRPFPVYRFQDGAWDTAFDLPRRGPFLPVGLDVGPDGLLYLLERDFTGIGFRSRVRRFTLSGENVETVLQTDNARFDNLEGISVWRDSQGDQRMTMVSDDNFRFLQQTQIVEFRLTD